MREESKVDVGREGVLATDVRRKQSSERACIDQQHPKTEAANQANPLTASL